MNVDKLALLENIRIVKTIHATNVSKSSLTVKTVLLIHVCNAPQATYLIKGCANVKAKPIN